MRLFALGLLIPLTACMTAPEAATPEDRACSNDGLEAYKGQVADADLGARLLAQSGAKTIRWVQHDMMVTMEFNPERLTVYLTADNRVDRASCG